MYQNLQSSVFGGGYQENEPIQFDKDASNHKFTSNADWKDQQTRQHPNNGISKLNPFVEHQK